jgi:hypothetical protein
MEGFGFQLGSHIRAIEIDEVLTCLDELQKQLGTMAQPEAALNGRYWLAMDLIRFFGPVVMAPTSLGRLKSHIERLLTNVIKPGAQASLPDYPGLTVNGLNIFHVLALYTVGDPLKTEVLFTSLKRAGLVSQSFLRAQCSESGFLPIHFAAEIGNMQMINELLKQDPEQILLVDSMSSTASDIARENGLSSIATYLRDKEIAERQKRQVGTAISELDRTDGNVKKRRLSTQAMEGLPSPVKKGAVDAMMDMLKQFQPDDALSGVVSAVVTKQTDTSQRDLNRLTDFIRQICNEIPAGPVMVDAYVSLFIRLGITKLSELKADIASPEVSARLPSWFKLEIELNIDRAISKYPG